MRQIPTSLALLTIGRLALVPAIIVALQRSAVLTFVLLAAFVILDLYDGVLARDLNADDPARRALDSVVDRLAIWPVFAATVTLGLLPLPFFVLLVGRDLYCGYLCQAMLREKGVVVRADWLYRALNLMLAGWVVVAPLMGSVTRLWLFTLVFAFALIVAADLRRAVQRVMGMSFSQAPKVLAASSLRPGKSIRELSAAGSPVSVASPAHL